MSMRRPIALTCCSATLVHAGVPARVTTPVKRRWPSTTSRTVTPLVLAVSVSACGCGGRHTSGFESRGDEGHSGAATAGAGDVSAGGVSAGGVSAGGVSAGGVSAGGVSAGGTLTGGSADGGASAAGSSGTVGSGGAASSTGSAPTGGTSGGTIGAGGGYCDGSWCNNLLTPEVLSSGWIGGDPTTAADDPSGVQGAIYLAGDQLGCFVTEGNPCTPAGCCLDYTTIVDPSFAAWGCRITVELNATGGAASIQRPYAGPARGLSIQATNSGDAEFRIAYSQHAEMSDWATPYFAASEGISTVEFTEVFCPSWDPQCTPPGNSPYALILQVVGGNAVSSGTLCLTGLYPF